MCCGIGDNFFQGRAVILENREVSDKTFFMRLMAPEIAKTAKPGQFIKFRGWPSVAEGGGPLLDRHFCLDLIGPGDEIALLYRVVGVGTSIMAGLKPSQAVQVSGPLGRGLDCLAIAAAKQPVYLVAGGAGIAPMPAVGRALKALKVETVLFYGEREAGLLVDPGLLEPNVGRLIRTVDCGPAGCADFTGTNPTGPLTRALAEKPGPVFACGPMRMLAAVHKCAVAAGVPAFVSLEARMGCGFGICLSCTVAAKNSGTLSVCHDGPVMLSTELDWDRMEDQ